MTDPVDDDWATFQSDALPPTEPSPQISDDLPAPEAIADVNDDDDDFGEFSEVQTTPTSTASSLPTVSE